MNRLGRVAGVNLYRVSYTVKTSGLIGAKLIICKEDELINILNTFDIISDVKILECDISLLMTKDSIEKLGLGMYASKEIL